MDSPKTVVKKEPRKSLLVLFAASVFFLLIGAAVLYFGAPGREPIVNQAGIIALIIGGLGFLLYGFARRKRTGRGRRR